MDADQLPHDLSTGDVTAGTCVSAAAERFHSRILRDRIPDHIRREKGGSQKIRDLTPKFVAHVYEAVQYRRSSGLKDQTEALAVMFNLREYFEDEERILASSDQDPQEKFMEALIQRLSNVCGLPAGFLFLKGEKLSKPGLRWAPKSWLNPQPSLTPNPLFCSDEPSYYSSAGLEVQLPGIRLSALTKKDADFAEAECIKLKNLLRVDEVYTVRPADEVRFPTTTIINDRQLAIITLHENVVQPTSIALLVAVNNKTKYAWFVEILNRVKLQREHDSAKVDDFKRRLHQSEKRYQEKGEPHVHMFGETIPKSQKWCVDGPSDRTLAARSETCDLDQAMVTRQRSSSSTRQGTQPPLRPSQTFQGAPRIPRSATDIPRLPRSATAPTRARSPHSNPPEPKKGSWGHTILSKLLPRRRSGSYQDSERMSVLHEEDVEPKLHDT